MVSTVLTGLFWCVAMFSLYSVIHLNYIEKTLNQYFISKEPENSWDISLPLEVLRDRYQNAFYWTAGAGVVFYMLPEII